MAAVLLLTEAFQLISDTTIQGTFFGINCSLYFLCVQLFYRLHRKAPSDERRKLLFSFIYNSLMVLAAALELGADTRLIQLAYIDHGGIHGEPAEFEAEAENVVSALRLLYIIPGFIIGTLSPIMQVWRTWVIWSTSPYKLVVTIVPFLFFIASLSIDIYLQTLPDITPGKIEVMWATVIVTLNLVFTVLVTLLLVGRIFVVRRRHNRLIGSSSERTNSHTNIVAMLIESYALDAAWSITLMISFSLNVGGNPDTVYQIFDNTSDQVTVIAFLLVTYRVLLGRAWTPETGRQLSTLRWNRDAPENSTTNTTTFADNWPSVPEYHSTVSNRESNSLA